MTGDRVTTVVATRNRLTDLRESLPRHDLPVVVVDNGSTDGTVDHVRRHHPDVTVMALGHNTGAVARNVGVRVARTPYVAFADDDSWWAPGALARAADHLDAAPRLALVAARVLVGDDEDDDPVNEPMRRSPLPRCADLPGPSILGFVACGAVVRRDAFLACGGFDPVVEFGGEEERVALDLAARGWGLAYVDDVVAHHHPSTTRGDAARARSRRARNRLLTAAMRRPSRVVATAALEQLGAGTPELRGTLQAGGRLAAAWRSRRVVPAWLESQRRLLGR